MKKLKKMCLCEACLECRRRLSERMGEDYRRGFLSVIAALRENA